MSAAMSAMPDGPAPDDAPGRGEVIPLAPRRRERATEAREQPAGDSPEGRMAHRLEEMFIDRGRTLRDPNTVTDLEVTVDAVLVFLDGAFVNGLISEDAHRKLHATIDGMKRAPDLL